MPAAATPPAAKPTYAKLVTAALGDYKKQSAQAIVKEVAAKRGEVDQNKCRHFVKLTLKRMVEKKQITQVKGQGATGSFKLIKTKAAAPKKVAKKVVKAVKKAVAKKTTKKAPKPSGAKKAKAPTKKAPKAAKKAPKAATTKKVAKAAAPAASAKKAKK